MIFFRKITIKSLKISFFGICDFLTLFFCINIVYTKGNGPTTFGSVRTTEPKNLLTFIHLFCDFGAFSPRLSGIFEDFPIFGSLWEAVSRWLLGVRWKCIPFSLSNFRELLIALCFAEQKEVSKFDPRRWKFEISKISNYHPYRGGLGRS